MTDEPNTLRPIPGDPGAAEIVAAFDLAGDDWLLSTPGEYMTGAAETMQDDGSNWQRVVILEWPCRRNHDHGPDAAMTLRLMVSPEDALGLAEVLAHTAAWLLGLASADGAT